MTLEKKAAEKAAEIVTGMYPRLGELYHEYCKVVASALLEFAREATEEKVDWVMRQHAKLRTETWFMDGYRKGFAQGLTRAAEILNQVDDACAKKCVETCGCLDRAIGFVRAEAPRNDVAPGEKGGGE